MAVKNNKIIAAQDLKQRLGNWKQEGKKIVFTNGCFDLVHLGHIQYLQEAKKQGDILIVGLNSDSSVNKIKGKGRPILDQNSRSEILAAFEFVDVVTLFDQDTPLELIEQLVPDVLIKGSDYLAENIVGSEIVLNSGGEVVTIDLVEGYSTSNIIKKVKKLQT